MFISFDVFNVFQMGIRKQKEGRQIYHRLVNGNQPKLESMSNQKVQMTRVSNL